MKQVKRILGIILLIFLFFSLTKNILDYRNTVSFYQSYKTEYEKEKKDNIVLKTEILKNNDKNEIEKTIRNKLNLMKENEVSVIVPLPSPTPTPFVPTPAPVYRQWFNIFFQN